MDFTKLKEPFTADDIEWRIQSSGMNGEKPWGKCLAYITNRAIMDRLDDVCGPGNWKNEFVPAPLGGILCRISIKCGNEWVTKEDGADNTEVEAIKGGLSASMKRSAVQWGIGRYLYKWDIGWAVFSKNGVNSAKIAGKYHKWSPPALPSEPKKPANNPQHNQNTPPKKTAFEIIGAELKACSTFAKIDQFIATERYQTFLANSSEANRKIADSLVTDRKKNFSGQGD